jgi:hypothetical protein
MGEQAYKPGSVPGTSPGGDHLSGTSVAGRLKQPTRGCGGPPHLPLRDLAPGGVCPGLRSPGASCALTARLHPCRWPSNPLPYESEPEDDAYRRYVSVALSLGSPPTGCYPAPCPVVPGLSSTGLRLQQSPGLLPALSYHPDWMAANSRRPGQSSRLTGRRSQQCALGSVPPAEQPSPVSAAL